MTVNKWRILIIPVIFMLSGCSSYSVRKHDDGIVVKLKKEKATDVKELKVQVCSENIFRIVATPFKTQKNPFSTNG